MRRRLLEMRGPFHLGSERVTHALEGLTLTPQQRARLLGWPGRLRWRGGEVTLAQADFEEALRQVRALGDASLEARYLNDLAIAWQTQGQGRQAREAYSMSLAIARRIHGRLQESVTPDGLALLDNNEGRFDSARTHLQSALNIDRAIGNVLLEGIHAGNLASVDQRQSRPETARQRLSLALAIASRINDR